MTARTRQHVLQLATPFIGVGLLIILTAILSPGLLAPTNWATLVILAALTGLVSLGQTFVILGGGIDLSIPWILNAAGIAGAFICDGSNAPLFYTLPLIVIGGALVGCCNGLGVAILRVPPLIMTLSVNVIVQGGVLIYTAGAPSPAAPPGMQFLSSGRIHGIPLIAFIWALVTVATILVLRKSSFGRYLLAVGTNKTAARLSGVPVDATIVASYAISGAGASFAGVVITGYSGQAYLGMGDAYLFTSVAAVAIGGTSILGGRGSYTGTIAGALTLTLLMSLLATLNLSTGALLITYGLVILVTVITSSRG
jgi:ribose transport system permease protein